MLIELNADGRTIVKMNVEVEPLIQLFSRSSHNARSHSVPRSTPLTTAQAQDLLSKVDPKSALFLRQIAANDGTITWEEMRKIFGIAEQDDWNAYALSYGKGITRALRHLLKDKSARLVWWIDEDWDNEPWGSDLVAVYIDGPALQAIKDATRQ